MAWRKSPPGLVQFIADATAPFEAAKKMMFGYPAYFVNNNLWAALHQEDFILRLAEADREEIQSGEDPARPFEPMAGRRMKEYVALPASVLDDADLLNHWLARGYDFVAALPPKVVKNKKRK